MCFVFVIPMLIKTLVSFEPTAEL